MPAAARVFNLSKWPQLDLSEHYSEIFCLPFPIISVCPVSPAKAPRVCLHHEAWPQFKWPDICLHLNAFDKDHFPSPESESAQQRISGSVPWPAAPSCVHRAPGTPPQEFPAPPLWSWCSPSAGSVRWCWCSVGGPGHARGPGSCSLGPWYSRWRRCGHGSLTSRSPCCGGSWGGRWGRRARWSVWRTCRRWEGKWVQIQNKVKHTEGTQWHDVLKVSKYSLKRTNIATVSEDCAVT